MLRESLKGIGCEIGIAGLSRGEEAAHQMVELALVDLLLRALSEDAACADVVEIVEVLGRVALHLVGIDGAQGLDGLPLETYIIIIGGIDNGILCLSIEEALLLTLCQRGTLLVDAVDATNGTFTVIVEVLVARTALAQAHLLDITYEQFKLIISQFRDFVQQFLRIVIGHAHDTDEGQIVERLSTACIITFSEVVSPLGASLHGVNIPIVIGIGLSIQHVHRLPISIGTG